MTSTQWQLSREAAERYEQILVPAILGPAARAFVARADVRAGERVLDVGCGTGAATRAAAERVEAAGRVLGMDVNAAMLAVAAELPPVSAAPIEWREGSALEMPFDDGAFDLVLCAQTLQFLPERGRALAEMRRVLKTGGRIALSVWSPLEESPYFHALVAAISRHIGAGVAAGLGAAFALGDAAALRELMIAARFDDVVLSTVRLEAALPALAGFVPRHISATPMIAGYAAASASAREAVVQDVAEALASFGDGGGGVRVPLGFHLVTARR